MLSAENFQIKGSLMESFVLRWCGWHHEESSLLKHTSFIGTQCLFDSMVNSREIRINKSLKIIFTSLLFHLPSSLLLARFELECKSFLGRQDPKENTDLENSGL
ncbi:CLUMA_CG000375, isoform A [Clunio marinus]|uniref:CLUMA_CG000375, isoform A n=1 Tax=Clunio marinus TaxID=568069 RepID=A0A1J1HFS7_9DIPT|nr:CLUMA_CG000375, isoform A [Clunio marinus]